MKKLVSSTNPLTPVLVVNATTGEVVSEEEANTHIMVLVKYVQEETQKLYANHKETFCEQIANAKLVGSPNSFARQKGYSSNYKTLPKKVLAKSRINELVLHKFTSEVASFVLNPNPRKQQPTFAPKISLGAVDKQMVSLSYDKENQTVSLLWKCWELNLLMEFWVPPKFVTKNIKKWCLPTITIENNKPIFRFTVEENYTPKPKKNEHAGLDLGRKTPYVLVITNNKGQRKAHYTTSLGLTKLNTKREQLIVQKKFLTTKINHHKQLGINTTKLEKERHYVTHKTTLLGTTIAQKMGSEIANKIEKHSTNTLNVENLTWVHGKKYGSRWNHSTQQTAIQQAVLRKGVKTKKVNPKNSSNMCARCTTPITHNTQKRTVHCATCKTNIDRDYNAALNIATKTCPNYTSMLGGNCSSPEQVIVETIPHKNTILRTPT